MIVYNQAFDLYHSIFRIIHLLKKFDDGVTIETERIRIWDFYFLFPNKIQDIRLKRDEADIRKLRKQFIKESNNPYEQITENRKVFEKIRPYQLAALNCMASYGIIDKLSLSQQQVKIVNKSILNRFAENFEELTPKERNTVALMTSHFYMMSLFGTEGLKSRTDLVESKYDA